MALKIITLEHPNFRHISIRLPGILAHTPVIFYRQIEAPHGVRWSDLDLLLVRFWESHSIRTKVMCPPYLPANDWSSVSTVWVPYLFPESIKGGILELVSEEPGASL